MIQKPPKRRYSSQYREWLTTRIREGKETCPICGERAEEGHHEGPHSAGRKADDWWMVPVCRRCHRMRHDFGDMAWLDLYHETHDQDATIADLDWIITLTQHALLLEFCSLMDKEFNHDWIDPRKTFKEIVIDQIAWIEAHHPEWIQSRPKRTSLGKRKPNKRGGCRPLSPNKRMSR